MMKSRPSIKFSLCASWIAHGVSLLVGFFLMPFVLHTLGKGQYGAWIFISSFTSYTALMYLGFGDTIKRFVAAYQACQNWDKLNRTVNVILAVYVVTASLVLIAAGLLCWQSPNFRDWDANALLEVRLVILVLGLNVACGMVGSVFGGVLLGIQRFDLQRGVTIGADLLRVTLTLLLLHAEWGLLTLAGILLTVSLAENLAYLVLAFVHVKSLSIRLRFLCMATLRECFGFSLFALIGNMACQLINATDTIIIGLVLGAEAIVPYFVAQRLSQFIQRPLMQIGEVCMPKAGELHARSDTAGIQQLVIRGMSLAFLLSAGVWIGAAFFGDALILTWVRDPYPESHTILIVLLFAQMVSAPLGIVRSIIFGTGDAKTPALMHLAEAVSNVILSLILIGPFGILGVALGTTIPILAVELGALLPYACRRLKLGLLSMIRSVLGPQVLPLTVLFAYCFWVETNFEIARGWEKLIAVAIGGGTALGCAVGASFLLRRNAGRVQSVVEAPSAPLPT
jgi:O-antigen/teichoic acid export membrane protein